MANFIEKLFRVDARVLKKYSREADRVLEYEKEMRALSDEDLKAKTPYFKELLKNRVTGNIDQETREKILNVNRKMIIERYGERGLINIEK